MHEVDVSGSLGGVLVFDKVSARTTGPHMAGMSGVAFTLDPGEIMLVRVEEGHERTLLADVALGLVAPDEGHVYFLGEDWSAMTARRQSGQRGRTRRVFDHYGWVTNLDVMENLCLLERHHSGRRTADIVGEAQLLARRFGLEHIPDLRPSRVHPMVLRKLEWVRAFLGTPDLMLLERPLLGTARADMDKLVGAVREAGQNGTAVLWITDEDRSWECEAIGCRKRYRLEGEMWVAA